MSSKPRLTPIELRLIVKEIDGGKGYAELGHELRFPKQTIRQAYLRQKERDSAAEGKGSAASERA